jgi:hypothetical protein
MPYLTLAEFKTRQAFEPSEVDEFLARPGRVNWFVECEQETSAEIDDALRRRYAVPFGVVLPATEPDPTLVPRTVKAWARAILTEMFEECRRIPGQEVAAGTSDITARANRAREAMGRAADANLPAHPELPLTSDKPNVSGVSLGGPFLHEDLTVHHAWARIAGRPL